MQHEALFTERSTASVGSGPNQNHASELTVPRLVILERTDEIVHTHTKRSGQFFGRISTFNKVRQSAPLSAACHSSADTAARQYATRCPFYKSFASVWLPGSAGSQPAPAAGETPALS